MSTISGAVSGAAGAPDAAPPQRRTLRVLVNTLAGVGAQLSTTLLGLIAAPFLVRFLGLEAYGLWALLMGLSIFVNVADLGLGSAFIKYAAEYAALGRRDRVRQVVTFGILFYVVLGLVCVPLTALLAKGAIAWLHLTPALARIAPALLVFVVGYAAASSAALMPQTLLVSIGYLRAASLVGVVGQIVFYAVALPMVIGGSGLTGMVWASVTKLAVMASLAFSLALRFFGNPLGNPLRFERQVSKQLLRFGGWIQVNSIASSINWETDRIIIGAFVGASSVGIYELANKAARAVRGLSLNLVNPLLPEVSAKSAAEGQREFASLYVEVSKHFMLITTALLGFLMAVAQPAVRIWLGGGFGQVAEMMVLLAATFLVMNMAVIGATMLRAVGRPQLEASYSLATAVVNVIATVLLVRRLGLFGVVLGTFIGGILGSAYFLVAFHKITGVSARSGWLRWSAKLLLVEACAGGAAAWAARAIPASAYVDRIAGVGTLACIGVGYVALLAALVALVRYFEPREWARVRAVVRRRSPGLHETVR